MEITQIAFFIAVMFVVLAFILILAWVAKRYLGGDRPSRSKGSPLRRRERRLSMVEAASISPRHKLVLVRRDNVEHLLLLGGGSELVVESRIQTSLPQSESISREREPQFGRNPSPTEGLGTPASGPELTRAAPATFPPTTYGSATAGNYEPSLYRRDDDNDDDARTEDFASSSTPDFGRQQGSEPDYFASNRGDTTTEERPSYLDNDDDAEQAPTSTYEKYRPSYSADRTTGAPLDQDPDDDRVELDDEEGDDQKQSRILSRFLRKDAPE